MITNKEALKVVYNIVYNSTYFSIRELKDLGFSKSQIDRFVGPYAVTMTKKYKK